MAEINEVLAGPMWGKVIDHMGQPALNGEPVKDFVKSLRKHITVKSGIDYILLDVEHFNDQDRQKIYEAVSKDYSQHLGRIWTYTGGPQVIVGLPQ